MRIYSEKKSNFRRKIMILKQSHSSEERKRWYPFDLFKIQLGADNPNNQRGEGPFGDIKKF